MNRIYSAKERAELHNESPENIQPEDEKIPDFPVEHLPPVLQKQAREISDICQVPLAMSAPMVLAIASASLGKGLRVKGPRGLTTPGNLYILVCKTSGSGGSISFNHAIAPLKGLQKSLRREFENSENPSIEAEIISISQQIESAKKNLREPMDSADREEITQSLEEYLKRQNELKKRNAGKLLYATDVTPEILAALLQEHGESLAHVDSDAADALGNILGTRYSDGKHSQDSLWLKSYTGEPVVIFRKNSEAIHLDAPCLTVLFVTTPDKMRELYNIPRLLEGGLLARFLACDPRARPMPIENDTVTFRTLSTDVSQPYEAAIFEALNKFRLAANDNPKVIEAVPAALKLMIDDWNHFCAHTSDGNESPFEARHTENAIRIAVVLHAFKHLEIIQQGPGTYNVRMFGDETPLDKETMQSALQIRDWFNLHQQAFLAPKRIAAEEAAWQKTETLLCKKFEHLGITARDLYSGRVVCRTPQEATKLLNQWCKEGRIIAFQRKPEGAGRPTIAYRMQREALDSALNLRGPKPS